MRQFSTRYVLPEKVYFGKTKKRKRTPMPAPNPIKQRSVRETTWRSAREPIAANCESPIEVRLLAALKTALPGDVRVWCQAEIGNYRADFVVMNSRIRINVECDGREWHSTDQQISHDRRRDDFMRKKGYAVLRFTGSDIYRDASDCATKVLDAFKPTRASQARYF